MIVPVGAVALAMLATSLPSTASTGTSWSSEPAWASNDASLSRRPSSSDSRSNIAPYSPGSNNLALDIGQVFLMGDLASNYNDSIGVQLHYTYGVSDLFGFDTSLGYSEHSDGKFAMTTVLTGMRTNLAWYDKVVPYVVFGLGFYKPSYMVQTTTGLNETLSPILFGVHLGPGIDLEVTKEMFFGAALTFHDVFGSERYTSTGQRQDVGGTFTSFLLHAGYTF